MILQELINKEVSDLTDRQGQFLKLHRNILECGSAMVNSIVSIAKSLKQIKEDKLYLEAGIESFEEYSEELLGLKRSQAYKYISVLEKLGEDFVHSSGKIGITKLSILAQVPEETRTQIVETVDVESTTISELKEQISSLEKQNKTLTDDYKNKEDKLQSDIDSYKTKINNLKSELSSLKENKDNSPMVRELENKIHSLEDSLASANELVKQSEDTCANYKVKISSLQKELSLNSSSELLEFKMAFNSLQNSIIHIKELISKVPEDKRHGCNNALRKVVESLC